MTPAFDNETKDLDLGNGHKGQLRYVDAELLGINLTHECTNPHHADVGAWIPLSPTPTAHHWLIESLEPLTISPSVQFTDCGTHGWIRGGLWVPAP